MAQILSMRVLIILSILVTTMGMMVRAERVNKSDSNTLLWSTGTQEDETDADLNNEDQIDGGFSSLDSMLQWAIGHSNPAKLQETAEEVQRLPPDDLNKRRMEIKELMENMKMPSDAQLMQVAITDLKNSSLTSEDRQRALQELLMLVESIDNAIDLHKLGGFAVVIGELSNSDPAIRTTSAWILGQASQNNPVVQKQVVELGALGKLIRMVESSSIEEALKALYAISALIRNNYGGQEIFYAEDGDIMLQEILRKSNIDIRLRKKSIFLVADLAEFQFENSDREDPRFFSNVYFLESVVDLTESTDLDLQEKALSAIKNLLQLRSTEVVFKKFYKLDRALEKMRQQLQQSVLEENEFAMEVESLRSEVQRILLKKRLNEVPALVPT